MDYDYSATGNYALTDYMQSIENNRPFKCFAARHVYFSQKMLFYTTQFLLQGQKDVLDEKFKIKELVIIFDEIRKLTFKLLAYGNNQACHQNEPNLQSVAQEPLTKLFDQVNAKKVELLDMIPRVLVIALTHKFPDDKDKVTEPGEEGGEEGPSKEAVLYEDSEKILVAQDKAEDNAARWRTLFVDLTDTHNDLKASLAPGKSVLMSKRMAALFYDRQNKFLEDIRAYMFTTLGLADDSSYSVRRVLLVLDALAATQLAIVSWP